MALISAMLKSFPSPQGAVAWSLLRALASFSIFKKSCNLGNGQESGNEKKWDWKGYWVNWDEQGKICHKRHLLDFLTPAANLRVYNSFPMTQINI